MKKNLLVICGGVSPEHEISVRSTKNVLAALDQSRYHIQVLGITQKGEWVVQDAEQLGASIEGGTRVSVVPGSRDCFHTSDGSLGEIDVIFPLLHGPNGEDGAVQGLLQLLGIPFVGPGVLGSAASMDKDVAKKLLRNEGIKVADWMLIRKGDTIPDHKDVVKKLGGVVFVKPANMGSSVGVTRVNDASAWISAVNEAQALDKKILVEELLSGRELECAVLGNEAPVASGVGEVVSGDVYSYEEKYADSSSAEIIIPAEVSENELTKLRETAVLAYKALECEGLSRVDMFLTDSGEVYVNEVNTMPGFTSISMYPKLWEAEGTSYSILLDKLIELAISKS